MEISAYRVWREKCTNYTHALISRLTVCNERPITICAIVKAGLCQGSLIWLKCDITQRQRSMRALVLFSLQRNLHANIGRMQLLGYSPQPACSGWSAGFISTCFYSSKGNTMRIFHSLPINWSKYQKHSIFEYAYSMVNQLILRILLPKAEGCKTFDNHLNPVMLVFSG